MVNKTIDNVIVVLLMIIITFQLWANFMPTAQSAGDTLNRSGVPLGSLFASDGLSMVLLMISLLVTVISGLSLLRLKK